MFFESLVNSQQMTVISEKWRRNEVSPTISLIYCLERVLRPQQGRKNVGGPQWTPRIEETKLRVQGEYGCWRLLDWGQERRELCRNLMLNVCRGLPQVFSTEIIVRACEETTQSRGKSIGTETMLGTNRRLGRVPFPSTRLRKFIIHR